MPSILFPPKQSSPIVGQKKIPTPPALPQNFSRFQPNVDELVAMRRRLRPVDHQQSATNFSQKARIVSNQKIRQNPIHNKSKIRYSKNVVSSESDASEVESKHSSASARSTRFQSRQKSLSPILPQNFPRNHEELHKQGHHEHSGVPNLLTTHLVDGLSGVATKSQTDESYREFFGVLSKRFREFTGSEGANVLNFFNTFDHLAKMYEMNANQKLTALKKLLGGTALKTYQSLPEHIQDNYQLLKQKFISNFTEISRPDKARRAYEERKQKKDESDENFFTDLWALGKLAWPQLPDDTLRDDMTYRFVYGLQDDIQEKVYMFGVAANLQEARERAVNAEIGLQMFKKSSQKVLVNVSSSGQLNSTHMNKNDDNLDREIKRIRQDLDKLLDRQQSGGNIQSPNRFNSEQQMSHQNAPQQRHFRPSFNSGQGRINFPHVSSNVPRQLLKAIFISQLFRLARLNSSLNLFSLRLKIILDKLIARGYNILLLKKAFKSFCAKCNIISFSDGSFLNHCNFPY